MADYSELAKKADALSARFDAVFGNTTPSAFGRLANEARREKNNEEAGRNLNVYKVQKNGSTASTPSGYGGPFTAAGAESEKRRVEKLNPGNTYVIK
jgi:hypothetical protein